MKNFIHRVLPNETLDYLEKKFNMPKQKILSVNNATQIYEGQWLYIESIDGFYYIVKPYDNLNKIASRYNIDESILTEINGVNAVFIGQRILIPINIKKEGD